MPQEVPPLYRNVLDFTTNSTNNSVEFDKLFNRRKKDDYYFWSLKENEVNKPVDRYYHQLPKMQEAISKVLNLSINDGAVFKNADDKNTKEDQLQQFFDSFPVNQQEFYYDIGRQIFLRGNCLVILRGDKKIGDFRWDIIESRRFDIVTSSSNEVSAKYNILGYNLKRKGQEDLLMLKKDYPNVIYLRSPIRSVLGIPPLILNQMVSNTVIAAIQKQYMIENAGAFSKDILFPASLGDKPNKMSGVEAQQLTDNINATLQDPSKATLITTKQLDKITVEMISGNPQFWNDYATKFVTHTASLAGLAPSFLLPPGEINRATKEQEYKEMIQYTIKPLNLMFSRLVQEMYRIWEVYTNTDFKLDVTCQNPKSALDMDYRLLEMIELVKIKLVQPNELRSQLGLEDYSEDQIKEVNTMLDKLATKPALTNMPKN
jgi:hypothetical protein